MDWLVLFFYMLNQILLGKQQLADKQLPAGQ